MLTSLVIGLIAGLSAGNALPHFLKGIQKENYPSALGNTPVPNLIAGWMGLAVSVGLFVWGSTYAATIDLIAAGLIGVLISGVLHARYGAFGRKQEAGVD